MNKRYKIIHFKLLSISHRKTNDDEKKQLNEEEFSIVTKAFLNWKFVEWLGELEFHESKLNPLRGFIEKASKHWQKLNKTGIFIDKQTVFFLSTRMITKRIKTEVCLCLCYGGEKRRKIHELLKLIHQLSMVDWFQCLANNDEETFNKLMIPGQKRVERDVVTFMFKFIWLQLLFF